MCCDAWKVALSGIALELKAACDHSDSLVARASGPAKAVGRANRHEGLADAIDRHQHGVMK